jgi:ribonuclease HI
MPSFTCRQCGSEFTLPDQVLERYPGWQPTQCLACRDRASGTTSAAAAPARRRTRSTATPAVDPDTGVFTDGGASPNPGPGGWGAVYVVAGEIIAEAHGHDPDTTNTRMELTALIEGAELVPAGTALTVYSDSNLAVRTITEWAAGWERQGWKRKTGPVENLDLVRKAYTRYRSRPELRLQWIKGHAGARWNEYADALANRWR